MPGRIAINGLGRIGRALLRILSERSDVDVVAVNDLQSSEDLAYLLRYDSVYGRAPQEVEAGERKLRYGDKEIPVFGEKDPAALPWNEYEVDAALECTGIFRSARDAQKHLEAGAKRALLSAPAKGGELPSILYGVSELGSSMPPLFDCASCTTNCVAPIAEVMDRRVGIAKAGMTTVHAYTSSQNVVDAAKKKRRRGRAAAVNLVPTTTGAAKAASKVLPSLDGRFDGAAVRAPVPSGSLVDLTFIAKQRTSVEEINAILEEEASSERYEGVLGATKDDLVSSDILGDTRASIADLGMTQVIDGDLVRVMAWYDNEWGYASQMARALSAALERDVEKR